MQFGCTVCERSFEELQIWSRVKNEGFKWICTSCNVPLVRDQSERNMEYGCRNCNFTFEELRKWKWLKHCGDYWQCKSCGGDITKHPRTVFQEATKMAHMIWHCG